PFFQRRGKTMASREPQRAVERAPAHHARIEKLALRTAEFPDARALAPPVFAQPVDQPRKVAPQLERNRLRRPVEDVGAFDQLAENVELELVERGVADAHGSRAAVTFEMAEFGLAQVFAAIDAIHRLELFGL